MPRSEDEPKPVNKYNRPVKGVTIDVYDVLAAFNVTSQPIGHADKQPTSWPDACLTMFGMAIGFALGLIIAWRLGVFDKD